MSITEGPHGDLTIDLRAREPYREFGHMPLEIAPNSLYMRDVKQFRISVHPSPNSDIITTIKTTIELDNNIIQTFVSYTTAVKGAPGFAPIFFRRCGDFDAEIYDFKNKKSTIHRLGAVHDDFILFYQVWVGPRSRTFNIENSYINIIQKRIGGFNICILYTYLSITMHILSATRVHIAKSELGPVAGIGESDCIGFFRRNAADLRQECIDTLEKDTSVGEYIKLIRNSKFFKFGLLSPEYWAWWDSLGGDVIRASAGVRNQRYPFKAQ